MSKKRQGASWIADEYGGSYLNNPEQQNRDLRSAHGMAVMIQRTVQAKGGDYYRTGELINETLRELSNRAPFGFVTPAFALGMTQVLLDKANQMEGRQFVQYLEGIKDRDNPLFFWQKTTLDPLLDEVKGRTRAHVEQVYGKSDFSVFSGMKGKTGDLAYLAGASDAVLNEMGQGARGMILAASNPIEAARQVVDMGRNLDKVPQALQQQFREAKELIAASRLDDYHKGYLDARILIAVLDAKDLVDAGMSLANLSKKLKGRQVNDIDDALRAFDEGPQTMRRQTPDGNSPNPAQVPQYRALTMRDVSDAAVARLPDDRQPAYRRALDEALQSRGISDPERARKFVADLNGAPDGPTMQGIHRRAMELIQGPAPPRSVADISVAAVKSVPDNVEWAYHRALRQTFNENGIRTPEAAEAFLQRLSRNPNGPEAKALNARAYGEVLDHAVQRLPINAQDYYRRAIHDMASEKGHKTISDVHKFVGDLAAAPQGQSMRALHNRAYGLFMDDAVGSAPQNVRGIYREALSQIFREKGLDTLSEARTYVDRLGGAPDGQSMRAVHARAYEVMIDNALDRGGIPQNARPAYRLALEENFSARGFDRLTDAKTHIDRLYGAPTGPSMQALHNRAFEIVVDNAVNSLPESSRAAYRQALREQFKTSGVDTVSEAQRYVVNLANSEKTLARLHARADEIMGVTRTTESPSTPPKTEAPPRTEAPPKAEPPPRAEAPPIDRTPPTDGANPPGGNDKPPRNNAPAAPMPEDPLVPGYALPRAQRVQPPAPIEGSGGARFDFAGVGEDGRVRLRPQGDIARDIPNELMFQPLTRNAQGQFAELGKTVNFDGEAYRFARFGPQDGKPGVNGFHLEHPTDPKRNVFVPDADAAKVSVGREVSYDDGRGQGPKTWRIERFELPGWQPDGKERGIRLVDPDNPQNKVFVPDRQSHTLTVRLGPDGETYRLGDMQHGVLRMRPAEPGREILVDPWKNMAFEARLNGRELEGTKTIRVDENGQWTATGPRQDGKVVTEAVRPGDVAPRWRDVYSPDFRGNFEVDAFALREAQTRARALDGASVDLPLRDPNFRSMPESVAPRLNPGRASLDDQADFIRAQSQSFAPGSRPHLTVFNIAFNNQGDAASVLQALRAFDQRHPDAPIDLVVYRPSFDSFKGKPGFDELQATLKEIGANIKYMEGDGVRQVIHAKGVAVGDNVLFTTGAVIDGSRHKADISMPLPESAGKTFRIYLDEAVLGNASVERRQQLAAELAQQGVLINDPVARLPYIARAQDGLIRGADKELFISVSELQNSKTAELIVERLAAKQDLRVELQFREMDPKSREILAEAKARFGDRLDVQDVSQWQPRPHFNTIIADGRQAYVGTAYPWPNQQEMVHHGVSFENGVLLQGDSVRRLKGQLDMYERLQPPNPGQKLLNPAPENAPDVGFRSNGRDNGPVSISAPPGSSIGVEINGGSVGPIQTASGNGNVQIDGRVRNVDDRNMRPDIHGNVQATDDQGIKITLQRPGSSGNTGTTVDVQGADVRGSIQSVIGDGNVQITTGQGQVSGSARQIIVEGDNNRQTRNLPPDATVGRIEQAVRNASDARQQVGDAVSVAPTGDTQASQVTLNQVRAAQGTRVGSVEQAINGPDAHGRQVAIQNVTAGGAVTVGSVRQSIDDGSLVRRQIGDEPAQPNRSVATPDATSEAPQRKLSPVSEEAGLNGQSTPYNPRFSSRHALTGEGEGRYTTISGHGKVEAESDVVGPNGRVPRASFQVPEGTTLHFLGLPGGVITDRLGQRADVGGDLTGVPLLKLGAGDTAPDILVLPANGTITIKGNPITVDKPEGVRLSELIREHGLSGNIVVSTCLQQTIAPGERAKWEGIVFDLPERYPQQVAPGRGDAPTREAPETVVQGNFFQRTWDRVLDTQLPAVGNLTVFASQSGPDSKWQAGIPLDAGAAVKKLQEYMANNAAGHPQASVDDVLRNIDPRRAADIRVGSSSLAGGVDFATGVQRMQTLQVAIDAGNVNGGALRWDDKAAAYQLKVTAVDGGYRLDGPLTVKPSESLTPLNVSGTRLSGQAGETLGLPSMSVKITDEYKPITLPAGTVLTQDNLNLFNRALADPEYRSRAGSQDYGATAKVNYPLSEPRLNADDPQNLFNRVFGRNGAEPIAELGAPTRKLEATVSPGVLGIETHNAPLNSTRIGFEIEGRQGPTVREILDTVQRMLPGQSKAPPPPELRSAQPQTPSDANPFAPTATSAALVVTAQNDGARALDAMNARLGVSPDTAVAAQLIDAVARESLRTGIRVDRLDVNQPTPQQPGGTLLIGTQFGVPPENERRFSMDIAAVLREDPKQLRADLQEVAQKQASTLASAPAPSLQPDPEQRTGNARAVA